MTGKAVTVTGAQWTNLHIASGIASGAPLSIQNKGAQPVLFAEGTTPPAEEADSAIVGVMPYETSLASTTGGAPAWAKCQSDGESVLFIQGVI